MKPRAYRDLGRRLRAWPGLLVCVTVHRKLWKVWRVGYARHGGHTSIIFFCRICGRQYARGRW
jgi:hypothetical protein